MTPEVGTELVDPVAGRKTVFTATAASTGGNHVEVQATSRVSRSEGEALLVQLMRR